MRIESIRKMSGIISLMTCGSPTRKFFIVLFLLSQMKFGRFRNVCVEMFDRYIVVLHYILNH